MNSVFRKSIHWKLLFLAGVAIIFISCKKDNHDDDPDTDEPQPIEVDIHMAVVKYVDGYDQPFYYKNGDMQQLTVNENTEVVPQGIFVSGKDVYIVGYEGEEYRLSYRPKKAIFYSAEERAYLKGLFVTERQIKP